ncbi:hypothetical protein BHM03_00051636 [Ensete ventricosum]|nr:hypothetical protein BHM03_00051636 [Ensete ventricosum]
MDVPIGSTGPNGYSADRPDSATSKSVPVKILSQVDHSDLKQLLLVSKTVNGAVSHSVGQGDSRGPSRHSSRDHADQLDLTDGGRTGAPTTRAGSRPALPDRRRPDRRTDRPGQAGIKHALPDKQRPDRRTDHPSQAGSRLARPDRRRPAKRATRGQSALGFISIKPLPGAPRGEALSQTTFLTISVVALT